MSKTSSLKLNLERAKKILLEKHGVFGPNLENLVDEFLDLNLDPGEEIWPFIRILLGEIQPKNYVDHQFKPATPDCEIYLFVWNSKKLKHKMEFKFALNGDNFYYLSLRKKNAF
ncbi:MAG: hypothetical protein V4487_04845 [Chlamydiota bacterium]